MEANGRVAGGAEGGRGRRKVERREAMRETADQKNNYNESTNHAFNIVPLIN